MYLLLRTNEIPVLLNAPASGDESNGHEWEASVTVPVKEGTLSVDDSGFVLQYRNKQTGRCDERATHKSNCRF